MADELRRSPTGPVDPVLEATLVAEHRLARRILIGIAVAVPVCMATWIGLIALALSGTATDLAGPFAMAAIIGVLTGVFFGTWAGFVSTTHTLEELDRKALRRPPRQMGDGTRARS